MGPCQSCSQFVAQHAQICPLCEGETGFGLLTRLRARPRALLALVGVLVVLLSAGGYVAGKILGDQEAATARDYLESRGTELDPGALESARAAELRTQEELRIKIVAAELKLEEAEPALEEIKRLRASLEALPSEAQLREAHQARQRELDETFKRRGRK